MRKGYIIWFNECHRSCLAGGSSLIKSLVLSIPGSSHHLSPKILPEDQIPALCVATRYIFNDSFAALNVTGRYVQTTNYFHFQVS